MTLSFSPIYPNIPASSKVSLTPAVNICSFAFIAPPGIFQLLPVDDFINRV